MTVDEVESAIANFIRKNRKDYPKNYLPYEDCITDGYTTGYSDALTDLAFLF